MSDTCPTVKIVRDGQVVVINLSDYDEKKHKIATGDSLPPLQPLAPEKKETLFGSSKQPSSWKLDNGTVVQLGDVVAQAYERSGLNVEDWNALPQDDREARIAEIVSETIPLAPAFKVAKRGRGNATRFFIIDTEGKQVGEEEFTTQGDAQAKLGEMKGA